MEDSGPRSMRARVVSALLSGFKASVRTIWFLLRIIIPITFAVFLLNWLGALSWIARFMSPLMSLIGLPGGASLVFISSAFLNIYSAIAIALAMTLDMRSATILAIMCLTAHNLIVETAVMKKTGSSAIKMVFLRITIAFLAAYAFNLLLPEYLGSVPFSSGAGTAASPEFLDMLAAWGLSTASLALKITLIVFGVMIAQRLLEEFRAMDSLSRLLSPVMRFFGLPRSASFLLIVINVVGYAYGAGIVEEQVKSGSMKPREADLFNHHAGMCHSLLEDTILFLAVGVPLFWISLPRIVLALMAVWLERARRRIFRRSFRVGTV
jgi:hypothetical protein